MIQTEEWQFVRTEWTSVEKYTKGASQNYVKTVENDQIVNKFVFLLRLGVEICNNSFSLFGTKSKRCVYTPP